MAIGSKYAPLTEWLQQCGKNSVRLTFDEINESTASRCTDAIRCRYFFI